MNNVLIICELINDKIAEVSLELLTKGKDLAGKLNCQLEAAILGKQLDNVENELFMYGVDVVHKGEHETLSPYTTLPHASVLIDLIKVEKPQVVLLGATSQGRDLGPRLSSALSCGLTADCTALEIGDHTDLKRGVEYKKLLYQIRPAFGGNIIATIINPECRPQMATVRDGVMKKEIYDKSHQGTVKRIDVQSILKPEDLIVKVSSQFINKTNNSSIQKLKSASVIVAGGYGVGSKENFNLLKELASILGGEVGASRAAVDAGFCESFRQIGQTGVTIRPKLYIACGISGQVQHTAGMDQSGVIISINNDKNAPINTIADYVIMGDVSEMVRKMIKQYKRNCK